MAINAYTGLQGHGKTYEVVLSVVLPALKSGRDVVTNIRGLKYDLICAHLKEPDPGCEFGKIRVVNNLQVQGDDFFPEYNDVDQKFEYTEKTVVQPGDLVAIDEAWRPWGTDSKCIKAHMSFFREHRQCVNSTGDSCDLVVITQDIGDIHTKLKSVIEMSLRFQKLKTLGLSKKYRIEVYEGAKLFKSKLISWTTRTYDKRIFPLYKSYASESGTGVEKVIDERQNIFKSGVFVVPIVLAVVFLAVGVWGVSSFFSGSWLEKKPETASTDKGVKTDATTQNTASAVPAVPAPQSPAAALAGAPSSSPAGATILGAVTISGDTWAVLSSPEGMRIASPSMIRSRGVSAVSVDSDKAVPAYLQ